MLAILLLRRNELVASDRLIEELWGEESPTSAGKIVQGYVSQLRRSLGVEGQARLRTRAPGYVLEVGDEEVDLDRFESLVARGREELRTGLVADASAHLAEALELWHGPPLADFQYEPFAQAAIARLEEQRLAALEQRIDADLQLGHDGALVGELEALVADHPMRERLRAQLMLALYRSGRQADALDVYQSTRRTLVDELAIEPSPALQQLEQAILRQDASLDRAPLEVDRWPEPVVATEPPEAEPVADVRRGPVTVLFCDLDESVSLGERLDPELLRSVLGRYYEVCTDAIARHGGCVEKFIGDAVVAVFGVPDAREDDALRAVRAATEIRDRFDALREELEAQLGLDLAVQIGVHSGVAIVPRKVAPEGSAVTGDTTNRAARLQQSAGPGEILLGAMTWRLVRNAVRVEPVTPPPVKGKRQTGRAFRLVELIEGASPLARRFEAPFVGRDEELSQLREAFARCRRERACHLFTVVGMAGIGKSRLALEAHARLAEDAQVLIGRCLPYGEGTAFWPLREMLVGALGEGVEHELDAMLAAHPEHAWIGPAVTGLLGLEARTASLEESFLAVRRLFELLADERPLAIAIEDAHWADNVLLDLVEHLADLVRDAPIFVLLLARPELYDVRPNWPGGRPNATTILLDRLPPAEADRLAAWLLDGVPLPDKARGRATSLAEGNPLFLEQLLAFAGEEPAETSDADLPPTIQALLAARLDRLGPAERALVERAAVLGTEFDLAALTELAPPSLAPTLATHVGALVRKELIRPTRASGPRETFRFRHGLIGDAAYRCIAKAQRAELHERVADWLGANRSRHDFYDEMSGYHLEQAYRCKVAVGAGRAETLALAAEASVRLESAARRALSRSDLASAAALLERASSLPADAESRHALLLADFAATLIESGRLLDAQRVLDDASGAAEEAGDEWAELRVLVEHQWLNIHRAVPGTSEHVREVVASALPVFERVDDQHGLCRARRLEASAEWTKARAAAAAAAWERAAVHAQAAGEEHERAAILMWVSSSMWFGPAPVELALTRCEQIREEVKGNPASEAEVLRHLGGLHALAGRFDAARVFFAASNAGFAELGIGINSVISHAVAVSEMLAGNNAGAERRLREGYDVLSTMGENALRSTTAAVLARAVLAQGRADEAKRYTEASEALGEPDDLLTQMVWRGVRARILADDGHAETAETLAREAVALAEDTDLVNFHADALADLAYVYESAGRIAEASAALDEALQLYEQKGNVVAASEVRGRVESLKVA